MEDEYIKFFHSPGIMTLWAFFVHVSRNVHSHESGNLGPQTGALLLVRECLEAEFEGKQLNRPMSM